jgi:hypothetical protein
VAARHARDTPEQQLSVVPDPLDATEDDAPDTTEAPALRARNTYLEGLHRELITAIAIVDAVQGLGYVFGAPANAPSLLLMNDFVPMETWGLVLAVAGLALFARWHVTGFVLGGIVLSIWAAFAVAVLVNGTATGWGVAWPAGLALLHLRALWLSVRRRGRGSPT